MTQKELDIKVTETLAQELQKGVPILMKDGFLETESLEEGSILKIKMLLASLSEKAMLENKTKDLAGS